MEISRRSFLKASGLTMGAVMASKFWLNNLFADELPAPNAMFLNEQFGLGKEEIQEILGIALSKGGDFSDLYFEYKITSSIAMEEDIIKSSSENISLGVGIRVLKGSQTGYGYTNELTKEKLRSAALTAAAIAASGGSKTPVDLTVIKPKISVYDMKAPLYKTDLQKKINLIKAGYESAQKYDSRITKISSGIADSIQFVTIANSEGLFVSDVRPQARLSVSATAESGDKRSTGRHSEGGRIGYNFYKKVKQPDEIGKKAAEEAIILLDAKDAPAGEQTVVLSRHQSGVMIHEAVGHPLEADGTWKKTSIMWDKLGKMVANPIVTIHDDATIPDYRGSLNVDDEGTETRDVMLIEKGKLVGYLNDKLAAKMLKTEPNGHGRRESFRHMPIPRMNNTILKNGDHEHDEIVSSVKKGFYAITYQGGMVNNTGKFTFSVNMGYRIENGKLTYPIKNATLIGSNIQILKEVDMIGNDTDFFIGTCGKEAQSVPVTCGTPTLRIKKMTVGGSV